jgi:ABC-type transporter MlaC component
MNKEQKSRYHELFQRYALSLYKRFNLKLDTSSIGYSIDNIIEHPKFTTVICSVDIKNLSKDVKVEKIPVEFKLIRGKGNRIQAVDISISNVSMVIEYRKRFYQMILEEGEDMNWFLDKFHDKVVANEEAIEKFSGILQ